MALLTGLQRIGRRGRQQPGAPDLDLQYLQGALVERVARQPVELPREPEPDIVRDAARVLTLEEQAHHGRGAHDGHSPEVVEEPHLLMTTPRDVDALGEALQR